MLLYATFPLIRIIKSFLSLSFTVHRSSFIFIHVNLSKVSSVYCCLLLLFGCILIHFSPDYNPAIQISYHTMPAHQYPPVVMIHSIILSNGDTINNGKWNMSRQANGVALGNRIMCHTLAPISYHYDVNTHF
jgi:hypothetical protein